jgi:hypothetical protein
MEVWRVDSAMYIDCGGVFWGRIRLRRSYCDELVLGYLKSIVQPRSVLCHLILDVGRKLDGVAHNIAVGYDMFLRVNHTLN